MITSHLKILNDYYVADLNTFQQGVITYPYSGLSDGMHSVTVKVWDVYNNSSDASIDFLVVSSAELAVQHLLNYPNPFIDKTTFSFQYNQPDVEMEMSDRYLFPEWTEGENPASYLFDQMDSG